MRTKSIVLFFLLYIGTLATDAQFSPDFLTRSDLNPADSNHLCLHIENSNFFKNNEYFNHFSEGYTLIGSLLQPTLDYHAGVKSKIQAGVHLLKFSGKERMDQIYPFFRFHHKLNTHLSVIFGTLYGTVNHKLSEPLFKPERYFTDNIETGIQFLVETRWADADIWVNWEKFIWYNDPFREALTFGISSEFSVFQKNSFSLSVPLQVLVHHKGGQINQTDETLETLTNISPGIAVELHLQNRLISLLRFENYFLLFKDNSTVPTLPFTKGKGSLSSLKAQGENIYLTASYWWGNNFYAFHGEELFSSASLALPGYYENMRKLLSLKADYTYRTKFTTFNASAGTYYDMVHKKWDYYMGLHLLFSPSFFLKNVNGKQE